MAIMYYGSKISENITVTPEGYLICRNVPIGRTGAMEYLAEELGLEDRRGKIIKVIRNQEELFSKSTIASFEGKPVTNNHPSKNLDVNTAGYVSKGHMSNVRGDGEFLIADLYITDPILIDEVKTKGKREVSCGYDCLWVPLSDGMYEQKNIIGNHVAVVQSGRAGPRVAIKDTKEEVERRKNMAKKTTISKSFLAALGFKHFAQDADPEDVEKAMDALAEGEEVQDEEEVEKEAADTKAVMDAIGELGVVIQGFSSRLAALEAKDSTSIEKSAADEEFEKLEKEVSDADPEEEEVKDSEVVEAEASDSNENVLAKLVQDMKPIIMAIPDEATRNKAAKQFAKTVRDARAGASTGVDGYSNVLKAITNNKKHAMDGAAQVTQNSAQTATTNWNKMNAHAQGGTK